MKTRLPYLRRLLACVLLAVLLAVSVPVSLPVEALFAVPFEAVTSTGEYLSVVKYNDTYSLYLPGYVDRKAVTVWYSGYGKLKCPSGEITSGNTGVFDLSESSYTFEESTVDGTRTYSVRVMGGSNSVPSLYITLDSGISLSWLHTNKNNKGSGQLRMLSGKGEEIYSGGLDTIKGRGNSSFTQAGLAPDKKSYSIKLEKKTELIPGAGKAKKWALIHMRVCDTFHYDWTGLCNLLGYQTYAALAGEGYANIAARFVDVYIDGEYRGVYILTERVDVNAAVDITDTEEYISSGSDDYTVIFDFSDPAILAGVKYYQYTSDAVKKQDFDITGGYLLEVNTGILEESCGFETKRGMMIDIKAPEACTREQVSYIARYFQLFENALYSETGYNEEGKHYSDYVDMESLANLMITCAFLKNWELFRTSTYMYLDTADSEHPRLTFGPAWDFETGAYMFNNDSTFYSKHQLYVDTQSKCYNIIGQLSTKGDYQQLMYKKQQELKKIINASVGSGKYAGIPHVNTLWRDALDSLEMNWARWDFENILDKKGGEYAGHANNYTYYAQEYVKALKTRQGIWNDFWDEKKYLLGLQVAKSPENGKCTLTAQVTGKAGSLIWYRLQEDNTLQVIPGATGWTYVATEEGTYYCIATGKSNVYYAGSESDILNKDTISFTSAPVVLGKADFVKPASTTSPPTTTTRPGAGFATLTDNNSTTAPTGQTTASGDAAQTSTATTTTTADASQDGEKMEPGMFRQAAQLVLSGLAAMFPLALLFGVVRLGMAALQHGGIGALLAWGLSWLFGMIRQFFT